MFKFETLNVWKESISFASEVYKLIKKFPNWETFNLSSQISRAAVSISLNIAEGSSRKSKADSRRFIQISLGSVYEVVSCLYIAKNQKYITSSEFDEAYERCEQISKMLHGFLNYLKG